MIIMDKNVRKYLIEIARQKDKFIYYSDVVKYCNLKINLNIQSDHDILSNIFIEVSTY